MTRPLAVAACLALGGCAPSFPPIAEPGGDAAFKARIATAYRPGMRADALRARLVAEGFAIAEDRSTGFATALSTPDNLPCYSLTRIDWREDRRGRILVIQASRQACT